MGIDLNKLRSDFPSLQKTYKHKPIIYFDNACMTLKPRQVTDAIISYYHDFPGCHGRTNHLFGAETTKKVEESRRKIQKFFNASSQLSEIEGLRILGPDNPRQRSGIINLLIEGIKTGDVSRIFNESENIMTRFGKLCVHSWYNSRHHPESLRISFSAYNTYEEIDIMLKTLKRILKFFRH